MKACLKLNDKVKGALLEHPEWIRTLEKTPIAVLEKYFRQADEQNTDAPKLGERGMKALNDISLIRGLY